MLPERLFRPPAADEPLDQVAAIDLVKNGTFNDEDGDLDLALAVSAFTRSCKLLRNDIDTANHWLHVDLVGTVSNRSAIGAR